MTKHADEGTNTREAEALAALADAAGASLDASISAGASSASRSAEGSAGAAPAWRGKKIGRFRLRSLLGQGSMGRVFLAEDTRLQRQVAIKVLSVTPDHPAAERKNVQFQREARAAAALDHPHVVNVLEIGEHRGMTYIATDLVDGGDVRRMIERTGPLPPGRACDLAADAADALAHAHEMGVVHRDVKPANLMVTRRGRVKLGDFGLADPGEPNDTNRMRDGVIGTPSCMAPEVARGQKATAASDQYSLAASLWQMLTGAPLFTGESAHHVLEKQVRAVPPPLSDLLPGLPPTLVEAVHRALAKDPAERFPSCEEFGRLLRSHAALLGGAGAGAGSGSVSGQSLSGVGWESVGDDARPAGRGKPVAALAAAGVAAAALLGGGAVWLTGAAPDAIAPAPLPTPAPPLSAAGPPAAAAPSTPLPEAVAVTPPDLAPAAAPGGAAGASADGPPELDASDTPALLALVADDTRVAVTGVVGEATPSASGKSMMVRFAGHEHGDFVVMWGQADFERMEEAFGGDGGSGLSGQRIRVTGELGSLFGAPVIRLRDPAAVERLPQ